MQKVPLIVFLLAAATATPAATLIVNSATDELAADDMLALREAVLLVNHGGDALTAFGRALTEGEAAQVQGAFGENTINFAGTTFPTGSTITLTNGELVLDANVTVTGPGAAVLTLSGNSANRAFYIKPGVTSVIAGLTVADGRARGTLSRDYGAGIYNGGTLTLRGCVMRSNVVSEAGGYGGGLANIGVALLDACTIGPGNSGYIGGATYVSPGGSLVLLNCTISGNSSSYFVGGVAVESGGTSSLTNCTVTANSDVGYAGGYGGEVPRLVNTIIAGNFSGNSASPDLRTFAEEVASLGHNLIGVGEGTGGWLAADLVGTRAVPANPRLGPLMNHGGPTPTHALLPNPPSPAINAGDDSVASQFDQRGPGFTRSYGTIDIGAYEFQYPVLKIFGGKNGAVVYWPTNDPSYEIVATSSLMEPDGWAVVSETPAVVGHNFHLTNSVSESPRFFRLHPR